MWRQIEIIKNEQGDSRMLVCQKCNSQQDSGKFCGVCGGTLELGDNVDDNKTHEPKENIGTKQQAATVATPQSQTSQSTESFKKGVSEYGNYFLNLLKNPTEALHTNDSQFLHGLISLILFAIASSLSLYFLANSMMKSMMGGIIETSIPFSVNFRLVFMAVILLAIAFTSALIMVKATKNQETVKTLLTQFGSLAVPFTAINALALLTGLAGFKVFTMILLGTSYGLFLCFVPVIFVYEKANLVNNNGQKVYVSLATVLIMAVLTSIFTIVILSEMISSIQETFSTFPF